MNQESFQCGFVKAALDNGLNPLQAIELLKVAVAPTLGKPPTSAVKPTTPSIKPSLPTNSPASPSFNPVQFNPYNNVAKTPNIQPTQANPHQGWKLKGYSSSGGQGDYIYQTPSGGYEHTNQAIDQQEEQDYNKRQGISSTPKPAAQPPTGQADWNSLSQIAPPQKGQITNGADLYQSSDNKYTLANKIENDPYASAVMSKPDSALTGSTNAAPPPDQMEHNLKLNLAQNPEANRMFQNWENQHGLSGASASNDPGVMDSILRELLQEMKGYSRQQPQRAQQMYNQLFQPPNY